MQTEMSEKQKAAVERGTRVHSMIAAGRQVRKIASNLKVCHKTVYAIDKKVESGEFGRKKYDSSTRFLLGAQELVQIGRFLSFNKFVTLDEIIKECILPCSKTSLSRFLASKSEFFFEVED